jgi:predicted permease
MIVPLYRLLLRLLPPGVRRRDGEEIAATFAQMWARMTGPADRLRCLARTFGRLPLVALAEWWDHLTRGRDARPLTPGGGDVMDLAWRLFPGALRSLRRAPAFAAAAALLLGLGVGSVTAMFTVVDHVFLRPLPYPLAERLVRLNGSQSLPAVDDLDAIRSVEAWAAAAIDYAHLTGEGDPLRIGQARVTDGFFDLFGAQPSLGRLLTPEDARAADVVVLAHGAWDRIWGGDGDLIGRTITIDGAPVVVAGVLSPSFVPPEALLDGRVADVWRPVDRSHPDAGDRYSRSLVAAGRLAGGTTLDDASRDAAALAERRARSFPDVYVRGDGSLVELPVIGLHEATVGDARERLRPLVSAVGLLLLVACVNVSHLFLARGMARSREMAVRRALGARGGAIAAQLLLESLLVAVAGAVVGVLLGSAALRAFLALAPGSLPRASAVALDGRVLASVALLTALVAAFFALLPALRPRRTGVADVLASAGRGATRGSPRWLREGLVAIEVALSLVLVFCAGLLARSALRLADEPLGFRVEDVWTVRVGLPEEAPAAERWTVRIERMAAAIRTAPGVRSVTYGLSAPLEDAGGTCCWSRPVGPVGTAARVEASIHPYAGDWVDVLEPRVVVGRPFTAEDARSGFPALLAEPLARELFGSAEGALGREVAVGEAPHRVSGVVAEDRHYGPLREHGRALYVPVASVPFVPDRVTLMVRMESAVDDVAGRLRDAVWTVEPDLPLPLVRSMDAWAGTATAGARFESWLFGVFASVTLLLAAGGIFGTLLYTVGLDRRELGIRLALGARVESVQARVLARSLRTAGAGIALGAAGAWAAGRLLESRLFGIDAADPATLAAAATVLLVTALFASWIPARRAGAVDPLETLRHD